jgi:hypothetical protein
VPDPTDNPFDPTAAVAMVRAYLDETTEIIETTRLGEHDGIFAVRFTLAWGDVYALQSTEHIPWSDPRWIAVRALFLPDSVLSLGPQPIGNGCVRIHLWAAQSLTNVERRA